MLKELTDEEKNKPKLRKKAEYNGLKMELDLEKISDRTVAINVNVRVRKVGYRSNPPSF